MEYENDYATISNILNQTGKIKVMNSTLEDAADPRMLDVREDNLDEHVAIQPGAIAYYSSMKKAAQRQLDEIKEDFEHWLKIKKLDVTKDWKGEKKPTIEAIACKVEIDYENEWKEWRDKIRMYQRIADDCDSIYEAWKAKGFTLKVFADLALRELTSKSSITIDEIMGANSYYGKK